MLNFDSPVNNLNDSIIANPHIIDSLFKDNFDFDELITNANDTGFDMDVSDIEDYLAIKYPPDAPEVTVNMFVNDTDTGTIRELTENEIKSVNGGVVLGVAVTGVVIVATAAVAIFIGVYIATSVIATATVYTHTTTRSGPSFIAI